MLFVPERRRTRRAQQRDPRGASASERSNWISRTWFRLIQERTRIAPPPW